MIEAGKYLRPMFYGGILVVVAVGIIAYLQWLGARP